jgi:excisionase family DNA binding protein
MAYFVLEPQAPAARDERNPRRNESQVEDLLQFVLAELSAGRTVTVTSQDHPLTSQQAADFIGVSRPTLIKLLGEFHVPVTQVGRHRRIAFSNVVKLKNEFENRREMALQEIQKISEEFGLYEDSSPNPLVRKH